MSDYSARRKIMVDTQVRPSDVTKFPIIDAMLSVPRELFVPRAVKESAYIGENCNLTAGRVVQPNHRVSKRRLATARLANNGKGLPPPDLQRDVFHRVHVGAITDRKVLTEVTDLDQGRASAHESYSTSSNGAGSERPCIEPSRGTDASNAWV